MQRMGMVISLKAGKVEEYKSLHAAVWPDVLEALRKGNIHNYTIFLKEPENMLFSYWEYMGSDYDADMEAIASSERIQAWWNICMPCQEPWETRKENEWWATMEEVFHSD